MTKPKDRPSTTVDEFLEAIHSFNNDQGVEPVDPREEGTYMEDDEDEEDVAQESARQEHLRRKAFHSRKVMMEMHPHMTKNVWELGSKKQKESNVLVVRLAAEQNSK